jgi:choline dehydrogenase-like flavoprotein
LKNWVSNASLSPKRDDFEWYGHHMGTTLMGTNMENSVVDENLKTHTVNNLYILSSSTFPTGGASNPTFTIIQLALRLSQHFTKII